MRAFPCLLLFPGLLHAASLQETWEMGYVGTDANGPHVLGYWKFDADAIGRDHSGKGHDLTLLGAQSVGDGRFGGALASFPGHPVSDTRHAALSAPKAKLSPQGAFTLEMWIKPKADWAASQRAYLLDKKYVDHQDYAWQITEADKGGARRFMVSLGFGNESHSLYSEPVKLNGDWQHVAFTYDGAGSAHFYHQGTHLGSAELPGKGPISPGHRALSLGDRLGSHYGGFPGFLDEVRLCDGVLVFEHVRLQLHSSRQVLRRMETGLKPVEITCTNLRRDVLKAAKLKLRLGEKEEEFLLPDLKSGSAYAVKYSLDTRLKPGAYSLQARFESGAYRNDNTIRFEIVPRLPPRMPVIMWGAGREEIARLKDIGFTHFIGMQDVGSGEMWKQKKLLPAGPPETIARIRQDLDEALRQGLEVIASLSPADELKSDPANLRINREGKVDERQDLCANLPDMAPFFQTVGQSTAKAYGDHPAFSAALINTEVRDHNALSFHPVDVEKYHQFAKSEIPPEAKNKWGVDHTQLKDFPANRVIPDDHPILKYYRWFWTVGDGWNALHTALSKGVKGSSRRDVWTFFDPAVRQPSISGAGGQVDVLSHWTYTYPDPQRIGLATDQLLAMSAANGRHQRVMKMTQLIWYRSQTAPIGSQPAGELVAWQDQDPDAAYITIAPMHLREAFWTKISRPVQGIMYHGWQSLVEVPNSTSAYRLTHPDTVHVLRDLIQQVVVPLGPTLMSLTDERAEVALLESFTSQMFARRGGYGSNNTWSADLWQAMQHAHVPVDILFEETLLKNGLSGRKLLLLPECDVLPQSVVTRLQEWQKRGGKIIADEFLCPAIRADVIVPSFKRVKQAAQDKARVLALAETLPTQLQGLGWSPKISCDHPEIILHSRRFGDALYVFAINDQREAGTYVGHHGLVMENGLPTRGRLTLKQESANVYDLTRHSLIVPKRDQEMAIQWPVDLGPGEGRLFMITPKPLIQLQVDVPATATCGHRVQIQAQITTTEAGPLQAAIPMEVEIQDSQGRRAEGSGHYAALHGQAEIQLDLAPNDDPGIWQVRVRELASGMESVKWFRVQK